MSPKFANCQNTTLGSARSLWNHVGPPDVIVGDISLEWFIRVDVETFARRFQQSNFNVA